MKLWKTKVKDKNVEARANDLQRIIEFLYLLFISMVSVDF